MWHIPTTDYLVAVEDDTSAYSAYSAYSSSYSARKLAETTGGNYEVFTPLEQIQTNMQGRSFGFSLCIALNAFLYIMKWMEIVTDPEATSGTYTL